MLLLFYRSASPSEPLPEGALSVVIGNRGTIPLFVGDVTIEQDGDDFAIVVDNVSSQTLAPGETRIIGITFSATEAGSRTATLRIPSSDPDGVLEVLLTGDGVLAPAPAIAVDPSSWAAGSAATGSGSPFVDVTVANVGTADLTVGTVVLTGTSFTKGTDTASAAVIPPGESRHVRVTFTPSTTGAKTGTLTIPSDGGADVVVSLTGTGTRVLAVFPTSWNAGSVTVTGGTSTLTAVVKSTGTVPVTVGSVAVTGTGFAKGTDNASSQVLDPAETATVAVVFDPASSGAKTGNLAVPSDATAGTVDVALSGTGVSDPVTPPPPPEPEPETISVSRFYLGRQAAPIVLPSGYLAGWGYSTSDPPRAMTVVKGGPPTGYAQIVDAARGEGPSLHGTWIGPPLAAQTINTTFTCTLPEAWRSKYLSGVTSALRILVWRAATNTLSFMSILHHATAVDAWKTLDEALPRRFPGGIPRTWETHAITINEGDRLVIQVGCRVLEGSTTAAPTRVRYGGSSTQADAGTIVSATPDAASWFDFTDPVLVLA